MQFKSVSRIAFLYFFCVPLTVFFRIFQDFLDVFTTYFWVVVDPLGQGSSDWKPGALQRLGRVVCGAWGSGAVRMDGIDVNGVDMVMGQNPGT